MVVNVEISSEMNSSVSQSVSQSALIKKTNQLTDSNL